MIRRNQLVLTMVRLPPLNKLLSLLSADGQLVWPIHPIHTSIHVMLVARADLEDPGYPVVLRLLPRLAWLAGVLLALDGRVVCDKDKTFAVVLDTID